MSEAVYVLIHAAFLYVAVGTVLQLIASRELLLRGRLLLVIAWPIIMRFENEVWMDPVIMWAKGERIIEQSEWPVGTSRQTIQCRDGREYSQRR